MEKTRRCRQTMGNLLIHFIWRTEGQVGGGRFGFGRGMLYVRGMETTKVRVVQKAPPQPPVKPVKKPSLKLSNSEGPRFFFVFVASLCFNKFIKIVYCNYFQTRALASRRASGGKVRWLLSFLHAQAACGPSNPWAQRSP